MGVFTIKSLQNDKYISDEVRASKLFMPLAYDEDNQLFLCDDGTVGFGFVCTPLTGSDEKIFQQVEAWLNEAVPKDTLESIKLVRSPDLNREIYQMVGMRDGNSDPTMRKSIKERAKFINHHTTERMLIESDRGVHDLGLVFDAKVMIEFKLPISGEQPSRSEVEEIMSLRAKIETTLKNCHLRPVRTTAHEFVRIMNWMLNRGENAGWRVSGTKWDSNQTLNLQCLDYDTEVVTDKNSLRIGENYVECMSAKRLPSLFQFGEALGYAGDMSGGMGGVRVDYMVCINIFFPEIDSLKQGIERKRQFAVNQASGPMVKFVPLLLDKKKDMDILYDSVHDGKRPFKLAFHVVIWGKDKDEVQSAAIGLRNHFNTMKFDLMPDAFIRLPVFLNCLPFNADRTAIENLQRYKTLTAREAAVLIPIFGEWKGTGTPHVNLFSRNGQLMTLSLHDTDSNMNGLVCAQSGSGKSFLNNEMILSYLSEGAQVWVIDVGRSYSKLCSALGGSEMIFSPESGVCLNPFPLMTSLDGSEATRDPNAELTPQQIKDDDGDEDTIVALLEAMAAPNDGLNDRQIAGLKKAVREVWMQHFRATTIDMVADHLCKSDDLRLRDIGEQLEAFTSRGGYGKYFVGDNNVSFRATFNVCELEELKSRKHLQSVVLLQLLSNISNACYQGDRSRKKLIVVDESWDLLRGSGSSNAGTAVPRFLEAAYRRMRKYNASIVMISQSIADMYTSEVGRAIAENSATTLLLGQKGDAIDRVRKNDQLSVSDWAAEQMKTVHTVPGVYSEIYCMSPYGQGIGRLIVSDFGRLLYSTRAEDVSAIKKRTDAGMNTVDAINDILSERRVQTNYREMGEAS